MSTFRRGYGRAEGQASNLGRGGDYNEYERGIYLGDRRALSELETPASSRRVERQDLPTAIGRTQGGGRQPEVESGYSGGASAFGIGSRQGPIGPEDAGEGYYGDGIDRGYASASPERAGARGSSYAEGLREAGTVMTPPGPHAGRGPKGYRRPDARILEDICARLTDHDELDASEIEVAVAGGRVHLSGTAESKRAKRLAEDLAAHVRGVEDVDNEIRVERSEPRKVEDLDFIY